MSRRHVPREEIARLRALVPQEPAEPRIPPGGRKEIGLAAHLLSRPAGRTIGAKTLNVFTTLARNRRLFWPWLRFAGRLMPRGRLPRDETELVILRVAVNCNAPYEWHQHVLIGVRAGLEPADIERVVEGPSAEGWTERRAAILQAVDELHLGRTISDTTWRRLRAFLGERELIELCMLAGNYEMLAGTLNALGVQVER